MKWLLIAALCVGQTLGHAQTPSKKELIQEVLRLQLPVIENLSRQVVQQPAKRLMQVAVGPLRERTPPEQREAVGKVVDNAVRSYVEESVPLLRARAINLAPSTIGATLDANFNEDELTQMIAWLKSPVNRKFQRLGREMYSGFVKQLAVEAGPLLDPRFQVLKQSVRAAFDSAPSESAASSPAIESAPALAPGR